MINTGEELAQYIEFTNLDNTATEDMMLDFFEKAKEYGKIAIGSVEMLVYQAAKAHEIWVGAKYKDSDLQAICEMTKDQLR